MARYIRIRRLCSWSLERNSMSREPDRTVRVLSVFPALYRAHRNFICSQTHEKCCEISLSAE